MTLALFKYQEEGAIFLASKERGALHDEPGVGKTAQVIRALDLIGAANRYLKAEGQRAYA